MADIGIPSDKTTAVKPIKPPASLILISFKSAFTANVWKLVARKFCGWAITPLCWKERRWLAESSKNFEEIHSQPGGFGTAHWGSPTCMFWSMVRMGERVGESAGAGAGWAVAGEVLAAPPRVLE